MKIFFTLLSICFLFLARAQNFNGQWKGGFVDNSTSFIGFGGERIDYVLELETRGTQVSGYSYTYFSEAGKRYYTICKLKGTINRATKEIVVTEFERTKYNTPRDFSNCFQTHKLKYSKENNETEILSGTWTPAPEQGGNCGFGRTSLTKRSIKNDAASDQRVVIPPVKRDPPAKDPNRDESVTKQQAKPVIKNQKKSVSKQPTTVAKTPVTKKTNPPVVKTKEVTRDPLPQKDTVRKEVSSMKPPSKKEELVVSSNLKFEQRINTVLKTIHIKNETFTVDFYDNGEIDGDSISVFYNGKLVLSHKRLTNKPITLTLTADPGKPVNELVMYAENLGEIPPNTALMIVHDGDNRYEARITSDTEKNGTIRFSYATRNNP